MFSDYFTDWEVNSDFSKEFVSLWDHWLKEESDMLNKVTEQEWLRFNELIRSISKHYQLSKVDMENQQIMSIGNIEDTFSTFEEMGRKTPDMFSKYVIPSLNCMITEEWDYTYIIWHKNNGALDQLLPFIKESRLEHFTN